MRLSKLPQGMPAVALAAASWGSIGIVVDVLYRFIPIGPLPVGFWRLALSSPALLVLSRIYAGSGFWRFQRRDLLPLLVMGVAAAAYQVCYFGAIPYIGVAAAVLLNICSAPIIIAILSSLWLREPLTWAIGAVLAAALAGAALLVGGSPEAATPAALVTGGALALAAGLAYSLLALAARRLAPRYHPTQPIAFAFSLGALLLLPFAASRGLDWRYPALGWVLLLYLGLVPTALGYALYLHGLRTTTATVSAIVVLLEPLISTALAVVVLHERLSPGGAVGGALLLASVVYLYWQQSRLVPVPPPLA